MLRYCTGLKLSPPEQHLRVFAAAEVTLPEVPAHFGVLLRAPKWGTLGNDVLADCTIAGAMHAEMYLAAQELMEIDFTALDAKDDYYALTGGQDTGLDLVTLANYWQGTGVRDWRGNLPADRHRIARWLSIRGSAAGSPDLDHVLLCAFLYGFAGAGIVVPDYIDATFEQGGVWDASSPQGGQYHFVPVFARADDLIGFVSWGKWCWGTRRFFQNQCKEALAGLKYPNDPHAGLFAEAA